MSINLLKAFLKSALLVIWSWFSLRSIELIYEFKDGISPFNIDAIILAAIPVAFIWAGIFIFAIFRIIKIEF